MKQHLKTIIQKKLSQDDFDLIKALAKGEYHGYVFEAREHIGLIYQLNIELPKKRGVERFFSY